MYNKEVNIGFHHFLYKYKYPGKDLIISSSTFKTVVNKGVYCVGFLGILVILPQTLNIWISKDTSGVSLTTWSGFLIGSLFWLFYGIIHKEKPIILTNLAVILMDLTVISGLILVK